MKRLLFVGAAATLMTALPLTVSPTSSQVVVVQEACGQATSCKKADDFICSTFNADHEGYACYTGCASEE